MKDIKTANRTEKSLVAKGASFATLWMSVPQISLSSHRIALLPSGHAYIHWKMGVFIPIGSGLKNIEEVKSLVQLTIANVLKTKL